MKFRKRLAAILLTLSMLGSVPAFAAEVTTPVPDMQITYRDITPYAEEKEWFTKIEGGRIWTRLWNYTRGVWETDWIDCGPAPT